MDELRDYLSDRLRLVFDFATLGAYEEQDHQVALTAPSQPSRQDVARKCGGGARPKHRSPAQPHAQASAVPCEKTAGAAARCSAAQAVAVQAIAHPPVAPSSGRRQRAGHVTAPQQPCIWPGS